LIQIQVQQLKVNYSNIFAEPISTFLNLFPPYPPNAVSENCVGKDKYGELECSWGIENAPQYNRTDFTV
jgi:hypothetical protein